jgi:hypothetical protein
MPESGSYGSVRGAAGNSRPYRECRPVAKDAAHTRARNPFQVRMSSSMAEVSQMVLLVSLQYLAGPPS